MLGKEENNKIKQIMKWIMTRGMIALLSHLRTAIPRGGLPIPVEALVEVSIHIESALRRSGILRYVRRIDIHEQGLEGRGLDECSGQQSVGLF